MVGVSYLLQYKMPVQLRDSTNIKIKFKETLRCIAKLNDHLIKQPNDPNK